MAYLYQVNISCLRTTADHVTHTRQHKTLAHHLADGSFQGDAKEIVIHLSAKLDWVLRETKSFGHSDVLACFSVLLEQPVRMRLELTQTEAIHFTNSHSPEPTMRRNRPLNHRS